jgi:hypothetical protein
MPHEFKALVVKQMLDVAPGACEKIIDAKDFMTGVQQPLAQMRPQKAGATGDKNALSVSHRISFSKLARSTCGDAALVALLNVISEELPEVSKARTTPA